MTKQELEQAIREGKDLRGADLGGADLSGANLRSADLRSADLRSANLSDAYLSGAYLSDADLSGADLSGAYLSDADLSGANLSYANLRSAALYGANLRGATLPTSEKWEEYLSQVVPALLTAGGKTLNSFTKPWVCHTWYNCPMAHAFNVNGILNVPPLLRPRAEQFIHFFDAGLIPCPAEAT